MNLYGFTLDEFNNLTPADREILNDKRKDQIEKRSWEHLMKTSNTIDLDVESAI
jgi:hypothetical protein